MKKCLAVIIATSTLASYITSFSSTAADDDFYKFVKGAIGRGLTTTILSYFKTEW